MHSRDRWKSGQSAQGAGPSQQRCCLVQGLRTQAATTAEPALKLPGLGPAGRTWQRVPWHQGYRSDFEKGEDEMGKVLLPRGIQS